MGALLGHHGLILKSGGVPPATGLLLHFDGANGSTVMVDERGHTFTAYGNAQLSTSRSQFGSSSLLLGSGDYISTPNDPIFNIAGDFTMEAWLWLDTLGSGDKAIFQTQNTGGLSFGLINGKLHTGANAIAYDVTSPADVPTGGFVHVASSRASGVLRLFIGGVGAGSASVSRTYTSSGNHTIGGHPSIASYSLAGNVDEFLYTPGVGKYTADFTPPTAPFS